MPNRSDEDNFADNDAGEREWVDDRRRRGLPVDDPDDINVDEFADAPPPRVQPLADRLGPLADAVPAAAAAAAAPAAAQSAKSIRQLRRERQRAAKQRQTAQRAHDRDAARHKAQLHARASPGPHSTEGGAVYSTRGPPPPQRHFGSGIGAAHLAQLHEFLDIGYSLGATPAAGPVAPNRGDRGFPRGGGGSGRGGRGPSFFRGGGRGHPSTRGGGRGQPPSRGGGRGSAPSRGGGRGPAN